MSEPLVSVVLAIDTLATGRETLAAVAQQTIAERVEVLLVGPKLDIPPELGGATVVQHDLRGLAAARAAGVLAATAPFVFIAETHGFPAPTCFERLVRVAEGGADAVMPRFVNANPGTARSWASLFATYAAFTGPEPRDLDTISLHNGLFRRKPLAAVAERRPDDLVYGIGLSVALRRRGARMTYAPDAVLYHLNVSRPASIVLDRFISSRLWAGMRRRWVSRVSLAAHVLLAPAVPVLFLVNVLRTDGWRALRRETPPGTLAVLALATLPIALGEAVGYAAGPGRAAERHVGLELNRRRHL